MNEGLAKSSLRDPLHFQDLGTAASMQADHVEALLPSFDVWKQLGQFLPTQAKSAQVIWDGRGSSKKMQSRKAEKAGRPG